MNMSVSSGVVDLLANANKRSSFVGRKYFFEGDLSQMSEAKRVATKLGIQTATEGGIPFVMSNEDFEKVTHYMIDNQIEGWWHYVSHEEFLKIMGE